MRLAVDFVMFNRSIRSKLIAASVIAGLAAPVAGCGTFLYPERKGQSGGRVDVGVVVMDSLWLLLFIVPGVIFLVVDFNNGTAYESGRR